MTRAVVYCRISRDDEGEAKGVARQEQDNRARCDREGWDIAQVLVENDISATKIERRKLYQGMLADLRAGKVDVVVVTELERLQRDMVGYAPLYEAADASKAKIAYGSNSIVDFASGDGIVEFEIKAAIGRDELRKIRKRTTRALRQNFADGKAHGTSPYGYRTTADHMLEIDPGESSVVRKLAAAVFAGRSIRDTCRDLNSQGATTRRGKPWTPATLRSVLGNPALFGARTHHDVIVKRNAWPFILTEARWTRLQAVRHTGNNKSQVGRPPKSLLGGIVRCAECGSAMYSKGNGQYACPQPVQSGGKSCGKVAIKSADVDSSVIASVKSWIGEQPAVVQAAPVAVDFAARERARLADLEAAFVAGTDGIDAAAYARMARALGERIAAADAKAAQAAQDAAEVARGDTLAARWDALDTSERREVIKSALVAVKVRAGTGDRLSFVYKGDGALAELDDTGDAGLTVVA